MAKKPGAGVCVHCLRYFHKRNWDHVMPRSWYPTSTPINMEKWKIPTCIKCNSEYGVLEEDMFTLLALTIERSASSAGIHERALRSIDPRQGTSKGDRKSRLAKRNRIMTSIMKGRDIPEVGVYPGLGERWKRPVGDQIGVEIPAEYFVKFSEKITRGIHFIETGELIEPPYKISFYAGEQDAIKPVSNIIRTTGSRYARGPGLEIHRAVPHDDPKMSMSEITLFGEVIMYSCVDNFDD